MKTIINIVGIAAILLLTAFAGQSPLKTVDETDEIRAALEMMRSDVNTAKVTVLNQVMKLTTEEADKFWPVYRQYEKDLAAVGDRKLVLIRDFYAHHDQGTLDNKNAKELADQWLKNVQDRLDLWKKYHKQISKAVSPVRAAQFLQVEHQMALFIDLNIASEMPAVGSAQKAKP